MRYSVIETYWALFRAFENPRTSHPFLYTYWVRVIHLAPSNYECYDPARTCKGLPWPHSPFLLINQSRAVLALAHLREHPQPTSPVFTQPGSMPVAATLNESPKLGLDAELRAKVTDCAPMLIAAVSAVWSVCCEVLRPARRGTHAAILVTHGRFATTWSTYLLSQSHRACRFDHSKARAKHRNASRMSTGQTSRQMNG